LEEILQAIAELFKKKVISPEVVIFLLENHSHLMLY